MAVPGPERLQKDERTMSAARALAMANAEAAARGTDLAQSLITITEEPAPAEHVWRIHYGPRDYKNCRGGFVVVVDESAGVVQRVIRGQ